MNSWPGLYQQFLSILADEQTTEHNNSFFHKHPLHRAVTMYGAMTANIEHFYVSFKHQ